MNDIDELQCKINGLARVVNLLLKPLGKELCQRCDGMGYMDGTMYGQRTTESCKLCQVDPYRDGAGVVSIEESK